MKIQIQYILKGYILNKQQTLILMEGTMVKIIFRVLMPDENWSGEFIYKKGGVIHRLFEKRTGLKINFVPFCKLSDNEDDFLQECIEADVIVTDSLAESFSSGQDSFFWKDRFDKIIRMSRWIKSKNHQRYLFLNLRHDCEIKDLEKIAIEINCWFDKTTAVMLRGKKTNRLKLLDKAC